MNFEQSDVNMNSFFLFGKSSFLLAFCYSCVKMNSLLNIYDILDVKNKSNI